ncbi:MAG TPA: phosphate ABC transporter substrate-binding protein [Anaerolineae bacterium]|nr:phosphate ABC transporter substrate-binding protein [Anaerolineae bacterium]
MYKKRLILYLFLLLTLLSCQTPPKLGDSRLKLAGSTTVEPMARDLITAFQERDPTNNITIRAGGSGIGIKGAGYNALHIGMASRQINPSEFELWPNLQQIPIARDGVAVVVNRQLYDAGVQALSIDQIAAIWRGDITNWQQVAGPNQPITVYDKELTGGTRSIFAQIVLGENDTNAPDGIIISSSEDAIIAILENPYAISIVSFAWQTEEVVGLSIITADGTPIPPTANNVATNRYPITRDLNFVINGEPTPLANQFIQFALSPTGQQIALDNGYLSVITAPNED